MRYVASLNYLDSADDTEKTLHVATDAFSTTPGSTPGSTPIRGGVANPALTERNIVDVGLIRGRSRVGFGELVANNEDGALDVFRGHAIDGRLHVVRYTDDDNAIFPSAYRTLFTGTMEQAQFSEKQVRIRTRDRQVFASSAFQPFKYGGTNVLPAGVDGIETDLKGKPIPRLLGACFNVSPVCVNTSRLIYQVHDGANWGPIRDVTAVYDSGALLTHGPDYASQAAMEATWPDPGTFRVWKAGGMFRLASAAEGEVTCDAVQGLIPAQRTAAYLFRAVLEGAGIASGNISAAHCAALDLANPSTLGIYAREERLNQDVLDDIARSVGAYWVSDVNGVLRIARLEAPAAPAVLALNSSNIYEDQIELIPLSEDGLPTHRVIVRGVPLGTVQQASGLVGSVGAARRARLAQPYQDAIATDSAVLTAHPLSPEMIVETRLACLGRVQEEAVRLLALHGVKRDSYRVVVKADAAMLDLIELGIVASITYSRFGLDAGKFFIVIGYQLDPTAGTASLTVWG